MLRKSGDDEELDSTQTDGTEHTENNDSDSCDAPVGGDASEGVSESWGNAAHFAMYIVKNIYRPYSASKICHATTPPFSGGYC